MKGTRRTIVIAAACLALVACGSPDPADDGGPPGLPGGGTSDHTGTPGDDPTSDNSGSSDNSDSGKGGHGSTEVTDEPPDIPGGPIDYDNTRTGGGRSPQDVQEDMRGQIADHCGRTLCGVKVVISGKGDCVDSVTPRPVQPGGKITVHARKCIDDEKPPSVEPSSESAEPESDSGGDAPAESGSGG